MLPLAHCVSPLGGTCACPVPLEDPAKSSMEHPQLEHWLQTWSCRNAVFTSFRLVKLLFMGTRGVLHLILHEGWAMSL